MTAPTVSIIVNTLNRADGLGQLLVALRQLTYPNFEVVVVAGPCTDHTMQVLEPFEGEIKVVRCDRPNLSMSRNIGICAAAGEIVAFIDDDGIPEPTWLDELVELYDPEVAGAGGVVFDHTGYRFQCRFNSSDRMGNASTGHDEPLDDWCFPGAWRFPYLIGTNSSFRRDRLVAVGGFDEEYEFYLDETDVCMRLVDAGWVLRQSPRAAVHHKFLPSGVRNSVRVTVDLFPVVKNKVYFAFTNARDERTLDQILLDAAEFVGRLRDGLQGHHEAERISDDDLLRGLARIEEAWEVGIAAGFRGRRVMIDRRIAASPPTFLPYRTVPRPEHRLHIAFVTQSLPPTDTGGIGRYMLDTARHLATEGHEVRIITTGEDHDTVDLEDGVWIHRILKDGPQPASELFDHVPDRIWRNAGAVADEIERIASYRPLDVVSAAMWDVEQLALLERSEIPVVTTLVTTLGITLRTRPEWREHDEWMASFGTPLLELERWVMEHSSSIHAISRAILDEAVTVASAEIDPARATVAGLGVEDHLGPVATRDGSETCEVLFVGRFEKRKGIDLVLDAVPTVLERHPDARVVLIGRDDLPGEHGDTFREVFEAKHAGAAWLDRVEFRGVVDDDELWAAYARSDVFVAPSRFESFGLIYVEAMMATTPVIALAQGAAVEVIDDGDTGILVGAEDAGELAAAISALVADPTRRAEMGAAGRRRYEEAFSVAAMARGLAGVLGEARPALVVGGTGS